MIPAPLAGIPETVATNSLIAAVIVAIVFLAVAPPLIYVQRQLPLADDWQALPAFGISALVAIVLGITHVFDAVTGAIAAAASGFVFLGIRWGKDIWPFNRNRK